MHTKFEWDEKKNKENQNKHGVDFETAQYTFADPKLILAEDTDHSQEEARYYCFGKVDEGILTVRFTQRANTIRIIGAGYWRKGKKYMKRKIIYTDEPIHARIIKNFLPRPEYLVLREKKKRVTLTLSQRSIQFFKHAAKKRKASYQEMIRKLLDYYVAGQKA